MFIFTTSIKLSGSESLHDDTRGGCAGDYLETHTVINSVNCSELCYPLANKTNIDKRSLGFFHYNNKYLIINGKYFQKAYPDPLCSGSLFTAILIIERRLGPIEISPFLFLFCPFFCVFSSQELFLTVEMPQF